MQTAMILTTSMLPPRKFTGSAFAALVRVPTEAATIKGTLSSQPHDVVEPYQAGLGHRRLDRAPMKMAAA
jgi:hypothetical protein